MNQDQEHLRLLSIFHYVLAGLMAFFACFPIFHLAMGLVMVFSPETFTGGKGQAPPEPVGWIFVIFGTAFIIAGWTMAACVFAAGRCLAKRKRHLFCLVVAGIQCIFMPFGTILGVFTILVITRDSVKALFQGTEAATMPSAPAPQ